jgi:site-specific DNA-methyltransferase (cytosine-N4-specific)
VPTTQTFLHGDARTLRGPESSVDLVVTSPPYFGLRDYGHDSEIGSESTPEAYVEQIMLVLKQCEYMLKPHGSVFMVIGDKYARRGGVDRKERGGNGDPGGRAHARKPQHGIPGVRDKSLAGLPFRVALAAVDAGWIWRQEIVWHKPNPLPESVTDRCQRAHETILHLTMSDRHYAAPAVREHDVWLFAVEGYRDPRGRKHPAVFPLPLVSRIIEDYCPPDGMVLDPFAGSGTSIVAARRLGRSAIGFDLNAEYIQIAIDRLEQERDR